MIPARLMRPYVGFKPTMPQNDAGLRTEPPVSLPVAQATRCAASAVPDPELDPPGTSWVFQGLRALPNTSMLPEANSWVLSLPRQIAPACRRRAATVQSSAAMKPAITFEAAVV